MTDEYEGERLALARNLGLQDHASWDEIYLRFKKQWSFWPENFAKVTAISVFICVIVLLIPVSWPIKLPISIIVILIIWIFLWLSFHLSVEDQYYSNLSAKPLLDRAKRGGLYR
jgi:amino acid permease